MNINMFFVFTSGPDSAGSEASVIPHHNTRDRGTTKSFSSHQCIHISLHLSCDLIRQTFAVIRKSLQIVLIATDV